MTQAELRKGIRGTVETVDDDGDARITFPSLGEIITIGEESLSLPSCWVRFTDLDKMLHYVGDQNAT